MTQSLKLTITWLLLLTATFISYFVKDLDANGLFVTILAYKKFLLIGLIYLDGMGAHWVYKTILAVLGGGLILGNLIWSTPFHC